MKSIGIPKTKNVHLHGVTTMKYRHFILYVFHYDITIRNKIWLPGGCLDLGIQIQTLGSNIKLWWYISMYRNIWLRNSILMSKLKYEQLEAVQIQGNKSNIKMGYMGWIPGLGYFPAKSSAQILL